MNTLPAEWVDLAQEVPYHPEKMQKKVLTSQGAKVILLAFSEGQELRTHTATSDVLIVGLEGEAAFTQQGDTRPLRSGQVIKVAAHEPHALKAVKNFKMLLIYS